MAFNGTFSNNTLFLTDNNAANTVNVSAFNIGNPFAQPFVPLAVQLAYTVDLGNSGTTTTVQVDGNGGNDTINLFDSAIEVGGSQAASYVVNAGRGNDFVDGSNYADVLNGDNGRDLIFGDDGNDIINGGNGRDFLEGENGNDTLNGDAGNDVIGGGRGADTISGGDGNDRMFGDGGRDVLNGDDGDDRYTGGGGRDTFVFDSDNSNESDELDRITDWNRGRDQIDLTGVTGLATVEVFTTASNRVDMLLLNSEGDTILTIDVKATSAGGRNILLQDSAYGDGANDRVLVNEGVTVDLPDTVVII